MSSNKIDTWPLISALEPDLAPYLPAIRGRLALDIGAGSDGIWAQDMARNYEKVVAFEPYPDIAAELGGSLKGLENVTVIQKAVCLTGGTVVLKPMTCDAHLENDQGLRVALPSVGLGAYTAALAKLDLVKVDVSGTETSFLIPLLAFLAATKPRIFVMCHSIENQFSIRVLLLRAGYTVVERIRPGRRTDHPFPEEHCWVVGIA